MSARVLLLAADALDRELVRRWSDDGTLPTFRRLFTETAWGTVENAPGLFVGAVWPSFWTSVSPVRHARYCFEQLRPGSYDFVRVRPTDTQAPPFWEALGRAGRRVAVLDIPKTYVSGGLNGIQVVDWGTHDPDYEGPVTWPASLAGEFVSKYGRDTVGNCNAHGRSGEYAKLRDQLLHRIERRKRMIVDTLRSGEWDALIAAFSESHCAGHQFWHIHDPLHAKHDRELAARLGDPLCDVYVALDRAIGEIIEQAGVADVIVLGSHGMRSHYDATFLLDDMLRRMEGARSSSRPKRARPSMIRRIWSRTPRGIRQLLSPFKESARSQLDPHPFTRRRFFDVPNNDACGAIRVNLAGREPAGKVAPGEFDAVCESIERELLAFTNADTGAPVVQRVWRIDEVFRGPNLHHLPDLIVEWNRDAPIARVHSPKTGEISGTYTKPRTGDHSPDGFFCMTGSGARSGRIGRNVSIMDFGPTIAERLGVELADVDGHSFAGAVFPDRASSAHA